MKEYFVIGFDDGPFSRDDKNVLVIGVAMRGPTVEHVVSCHVEVDGEDATVTLLETIQFKHLHCIFLDGIAFGGFNIINPKEIYEKTKIPVITIMRNEPKWEKFFAALEKLSTKKVDIVKSMPKPEYINGMWIQRFGIERDKAEEILQKSCFTSTIPESVRLAHLIAKGAIYK